MWCHAFRRPTRTSLRRLAVTARTLAFARRPLPALAATVAATPSTVASTFPSAISSRTGRLVRCEGFLPLAWPTLTRRAGTTIAASTASASPVPTLSALTTFTTFTAVPRFATLR